MSKFLPKSYQESIYSIDYNKLYDSGIRCILFDLDNTLVAPNINVPHDELIDFMNTLKSKKFRVFIFSNSPSFRVNVFKNKLGIDAISSATKPLKRNFLKVINKYNFKSEEIAIVGDQLLTDVLGGNSVGITTILINPISDKDGIFTIFNRIIEKIIFKKLKKNYNFEKGKYYE